MKVIDLLNKIANGEKVSKFEYCGGTYIYNENIGKYYFKDMWFDFNSLEVLNDEVEIIEDNKIEKLPLDGYNSSYHNIIKEEWCESEEIIITKLNEVIDKVNSMENK